MPLALSTGCWSSCFLPDDVAGQAGRTCCSRLGWRWAGVPPSRCRSGLSAISLGYRRRNELSASGAARACAMGGASVWECGRVDVNTQHDVSIGLEPCSISSAIFSHSFQLGGSLSPSSKSRRRGIIVLLDPIGPDCGRRTILGTRHTCSPARCCLSLTLSRRSPASNCRK